MMSLAVVVEEKRITYSYEVTAVIFVKQVLDFMAHLFNPQKAVSLIEHAHTLHYNTEHSMEEEREQSTNIKHMNCSRGR